MKLLTYKTQDTEPRLGFIHNNQVIDMQDFGDVSNFPLPNDMLELIDMGFEIIPEITEMIAETPENFVEEIAYEMNEVTILAPIEKPRKNIIGIGLNYTEHVAESARTLDTTGKLGTIFFIYSRQTSPQDQFRENINMAIQNIQGQKIDLDKYVEISEGQIRTIITNGDLIESKRLNANGLEFHKVIFTGEQGIFKLKFEQYYWLKNGNAYILTFSCEQNQFDTYKPVGERILNSFRLK